MFFNCKNFIISAFDSPNLHADLSHMFSNCKSFNADIGNWNTINVTNMKSILSGRVPFNADISK